MMVQSVEDINLLQCEFDHNKSFIDFYRTHMIDENVSKDYLTLDFAPIFYFLLLANF